MLYRNSNRINHASVFWNNEIFERYNVIEKLLFSSDPELSRLCFRKWRQHEIKRYLALEEIFDIKHQS